MAESSRKLVDRVSRFFSASFFQSLNEVAFFKDPGFFLTLIILASLALILIPIPGPLLDFFMILNLILSLLVIITVVNTKSVLEFSVFPTILLFSTAFRLAVNVSSTRLILSLGTSFDGNVVKAFSNFVTGGSYVIGLVIFIIIITVQFLVITKGATRASEVSARFKLDALPGKQIAIDADLNAGLIDQKEAIKRREEIQREADFYGSMDGASKFVSGEVVASIIITIINLIGGIVIGVFFHGDSLAAATEVYFKFAIGDGLVASLPSLVIAIAAGIIITRSVNKESIGNEVASQIAVSPIPFYLISVFVFAISFIPGFPKLVFIPVAFFLAYFAYELGKRKEQAEIEPAEKETQEPDNDQIELSPEKIAERLQVDPLQIEIGYNLITLADKSQGGDLLEKIKKIRRQIALELGLIFPEVRILDNMELDGNRYKINLQGSTIGSFFLQANNLLAIDNTRGKLSLPLPMVKEPAFNMPAYWVGKKEKNKLEKQGFLVIDPTNVLTTHLQKLVEQHAGEILTRTETATLLDAFKKKNPTLAEEMLNLKIKNGLVQKVLQLLLEERCSIRNLNRIMETLLDSISANLSLIEVVENIRYTLRRQISSQFADQNDNINTIVFSPEIEQLLLAAFQEVGQGDKTQRMLNLPPDKLQLLLKKINDAILQAEKKGYIPVLLVEDALRSPLATILHPSFASLSILAKREIADGYAIHIITQI